MEGIDLRSLLVTTVPLAIGMYLGNWLDNKLQNQENIANFNRIEPKDRKHRELLKVLFIGLGGAMGRLVGFALNNPSF